MKPLVSIIIPVYNTENYLKRCLDSLIYQTLENIEIICINDASKDNSLSILKEYAKKDNRVKVIDLKVNQRQGGARNAGLKVAKGKYIGFVDSDDWVEIEMYKSLYEKIEKDKVDICVCDYYEINTETGSKNKIELPNSHIFTLQEVEKKKKIIIDGARLVCSLIKKEIIINNNLFFPEGVIYEDNAVGSAIFLAAADITKVNKPFYYYRQENSSTTRAINNYNYFDRLKTSVMFLENMKRIGVYETYKEEIDYRFYSFYYINSVFGCINLFSPPAINELIFIKESVPRYVNIKSNKYYKKLPFQIKVFLNILKINVRWAVSLFLILKKVRRLGK